MIQAIPDFQDVDDLVEPVPVAGMASQYNRTTAEMQTYVERNGLDTALRASLRERKTLQELRDVVQIVDAAPAAQPSGDDA